MSKLNALGESIISLGMDQLFLALPGRRMLPSDVVSPAAAAAIARDSSSSSADEEAVGNMMLSVSGSERMELPRCIPFISQLLPQSRYDINFLALEDGLSPDLEPPPDRLIWEPFWSPPTRIRL